MKYTLAAEINPLINSLDKVLADEGLSDDEGSRGSLSSVKQALNDGKEWRNDLADTLQQVFRNLPHIGHKVPRDLLWFAGSECLHFLDDAEIERYASIDEVWQTTQLSWQEAVAKTLSN
ncbi:hypothetical protein [Salinibius halmophilus]|uniref:hypothetical protein n=1 Tax=Salinibius halmophilus TaxID=1853216 RepID=UPI000E675EBE|nr:hypothetical protein [Salinibius halmophilus]